MFVDCIWFPFDFLFFFHSEFCSFCFDSLGFMSFQQHSFGFPFTPFSSTGIRLAKSALQNTTLRTSSQRNLRWTCWKRTCTSTPVSFGSFQLPFMCFEFFWVSVNSLLSWLIAFSFLLISSSFFPPNFAHFAWFLGLHGISAAFLRISLQALFLHWQKSCK